jgi:hypothetical protein
MSAAIGPDEIAEDLVASADLFEPGEWALVEGQAVELLVVARAGDVDPRDAAQLLVGLEANMQDDQIDLEAATALAYVGRIV